MHPLKILFGFFVRFLPSFTAIGYTIRSLTFDKTAPDFSGQTWLITGASGGLGAAMTLRAVQHGATVIAVARSAVKLEALRDSAGTGRERIEIRVADCASIAAMAALAERLRESRIDVLVNNVGVMLDSYQETTEGVETSFATNVLGPFALTESLRANGVLTENASIIAMSSGGMYNVPLLPSALESSAADHDGTRSYAFHKRAQLALVAHWQSEAKAGQRCYAMHPGWVDTPGVQSSMPTFRQLLRLVLRDAPQGIDTAIWLAANRPPAATDKIWFDRKPRAAHIFAFTRNHSVADDTIVAALRQRLAAITTATPVVSDGQRETV